MPSVYAKVSLSRKYLQVVDMEQRIREIGWRKSVVLNMYLLVLNIPRFLCSDVFVAWLSTNLK